MEYQHIETQYFYVAILEVLSQSRNVERWSLFDVLKSRLGYRAQDLIILSEIQLLSQPNRRSFLF